MVVEQIVITRKKPTIEILSGVGGCCTLLN